MQQATSLAFHQGPIPPPSILAAYDKIVPGSAERILAMAEKQALHRQGIETKLVDIETKLESRGQIFGFTLGFICVTGGIILIALGKNVGGLTTLIAALGSLVGTYIYGRKQAKKLL